ncbi:MAG: hypothetical protein IAF94_20730 [Pirellulaceae bacterium]|nr:hypothetical protein [Pirellulaceae bacterium]
MGSYLFSQSDADDSRRTAPAFAAFLKGIQAAAIVLWTSKNKRGVLDRLRTELIWWKNHTPQTLFDCPLQGTMHKCLSVASKSFATLGLPSDDQWAMHFNWGRAPTTASLLALANGHCVTQ